MLIRHADECNSILEAAWQVFASAEKTGNKTPDPLAVRALIFSVREYYSPVKIDQSERVRLFFEAEQIGSSCYHAISEMRRKQS